MTAQFERLFDLYDFIEAFIAKNGYPPSIEEIGAGVGVARMTVHKHLKTMENTGMIVRRRGALRAIRLLSREPDWDAIDTE